MIFNVTMDVMKLFLGLDMTAVFYYEDETKIDLYTPQGSIVLKSTYFKTGDEQDLIWKQDHLGRAMRILSIEKNDFKITIGTQ